MNALGLLVRRLTVAYRTLPGRRDWLCVGALLLAFSILAFPIGYGAGFFAPGSALPWPLAARVVLTALLLPAIVEETLFRVLLLPHPSERAPTRTIFLWALMSLVVFVASHPLNAFFFAPSERPTSTNPVFLFLAALLGLVCTLAYLRSGSVWAPVAIHWIVVVVWLLYLGGYQRLHA